jgi:D-alanyl-D-alanine carboxypeptidase
MKFLSDYMMEKKSYQKLFIHHMNKAASKLKLYDTRFANVHGLMNDKAYSTSHNISLLTCIAMKNNTFAELVGKKEFSCKVYNRTFSQYRNVSWKNTNRLLNTEGFVGVKTGVTPSAGPCLASMFRTNSS